MGPPRIATFGLACFIMVSAPHLAFAQASGLELSYEYSRYGSGANATSAPLGGSLVLALHAIGPVSVLGFADFSRAHESSTDFSITEDVTTTFLAYGAGIRVGGMKEGIAPFLQIGGGAISQRASTRATGPFLDVDLSSTNTHALAQAGGGMTHPLKGRFRIAAEADYRRIFVSGNPLNGFRVSAGVRRNF